MNLLINELLKSKAYLGKKNWNRNTSPYILGLRPVQRILNNSSNKTIVPTHNNISGIPSKPVNSFSLKKIKLLRKPSAFAVFNLEKTLVSLSQSILFIQMLFKNSKLNNSIPHILIIGGKINNHSGSFHLDLFRILNQWIHLKFNLNSNIKPILSFVQDKWVGGMLTNWKQVSESLRVYTKFKFKFESFLEKHLIHFPIYEKYDKRYSGLTHIGTSVPDLIIITNPEENEILIKEAYILKIPVIAFTNSDLPNTLFAKIQYPILGNNASPQFVYFCLNLLFTAMQFNNGRGAPLSKII
jgi:ribosomal protein S2